MFAAISFYLLYFFVNVGGLKAELASAVFLIAKFWDAITDYLMGRISDKTKSKWGKRRVYMLFGAIPYGLAFLLLWLAPFGENAQAGKMIYYTLAYMLFNTTWTVVYIPYNAITANMTDDYDERTYSKRYKNCACQRRNYTRRGVVCAFRRRTGKFVLLAFGKF